MKIGFTRPVVCILVACVVIASACGSSKSSNSKSPSTSGGGTVSATADPNATINAPLSQGTDNIANPHTWAGGLNGWWEYAKLYDALVQLAPGDKNLAPMLATSWSWNSDNTELTMHLRQGVQFQDGEAFNADVAVANLKAGTAPGSNGAVQLANMTSVVAVDPNTIRLTFSAPDPDAIFALAGYAGMEVSPYGLAHPTTLVQHPQGSGPYSLESVSASLTFTFDYFPGYWNKSHVFPAKWIETSVIQENARINAMQTGVGDYTSISNITYPTAKADKNLQTVVQPQTTPYYLFMNNTVAPFNNPDVRQAAWLAIDRSAFDASQDGLCPPETQAIPAGLVGNIPSYKAPSQDVAKAKQLIQSAGANGAKVTLLSIQYEPYPTFAQIAEAQLNAIGLNVSIKSLPPGATFRTMYQQGGYGMLLAPPSITYPDTSQILDMYVAGVGNPGTKDPALLAQIKSAEALAIGSSQRTKAMEAINMELMTPAQMLWVPVCHGSNIWVASSKIMGLNAMPLGTLTAGPTSTYLQVGK
jgi:ABC-type transport system substrate-binding protein